MKNQKTITTRLHPLNLLPRRRPLSRNTPPPPQIFSDGEQYQRSCRYRFESSQTLHLSEPFPPTLVVSSRHSHAFCRSCASRDSEHPSVIPAKAGIRDSIPFRPRVRPLPLPRNETAHGLTKIRTGSAENKTAPLGCIARISNHFSHKRESIMRNSEVLIFCAIRLEVSSLPRNGTVPLYL